MFQREVPLFSEVLKFPHNTVWDRSDEAPLPKTNSIRSAVSIELRLVMDRQTNGQTSVHMTTYTALA